MSAKAAYAVGAPLTGHKRAARAVKLLGNGGKDQPRRADGRWI